MTKYSVGVVGTGDPDDGNFAVAYGHGNAYRELDDTELVACADIIKENAFKFAEEFDIDDGSVYDTHEAMLADHDLDLVGVCTPHNAHTEPVLDAAAASSTKGIHCEKPMALTWGDCQLMAQECWRRGVQLTFNHQRRFGEPFQNAKALLDEGTIGNLERVEFSIGDLFTYGSHSFDLCSYFNDDHVGDWVISQVDYRTEQVVLGSHNENQALALWQYENGVYGMASTGEGHDLIGAHNRLVGTEGVIELLPENHPVTECRVRHHGDEPWQVHDFSDAERTHTRDGLADAVDALERGREPELSARKALNSTELIFACWESVRRRGRVDLPLEIDDNPLEALVESGEIRPQRDESNPPSDS